VGGQEPMEQAEGIGFGPWGNGLCQVGQPNQQQQDERHRRQQRVEGQGTCEERNVVFVGRLQRAANEAGG
jgi:hypothetical protein